MTETVQLIGDSCYHVYNRGNNRELIFKGHDDYVLFLRLVKKYILPVADIYVYSLLGNHFHLVLKIKAYQHDSDIGRPVNPSQAFSNLFNSYSRSFNLKYNRTGKLFSENFKRKEVTDDHYFTQLVYYIHSNAQRHRLTQDFRKYAYSSYLSILSQNNSLVNTQHTLDWFGGKELFEAYHLFEHQFVYEQILESSAFEGEVTKNNSRNLGG